MSKTDSQLKLAKTLDKLTDLESPAVDKNILFDLQAKKRQADQANKMASLRAKLGNVDNSETDRAVDILTSGDFASKAAQMKQARAERLAKKLQLETLTTNEVLPAKYAIGAILGD